MVLRSGRCVSQRIAERARSCPRCSHTHSRVLGHVPILKRPCDPAVIISTLRMWRLPGWELATHRIIQANIDRFNDLLKSETDPTKRAMVILLFAEEEAKREQVPKPEKRLLRLSSVSISAWARSGGVHVQGLVV